jgi:formate dehydrogenase subunit gamma
MLLPAGAAEWGETEGGLAMATLLGHARLIAGALALAFMLMLSPPAGAQHVNPTAESVKEEQLLGELKRIAGECTIPDQKACTLEQPAGRGWRRFHEVALPWIGAIAILGMIGVVVLFYLVIGTVRISPHRSGRVMARFSSLDRFAHWMTAVCFIILMLTGLNITFGKQLILPLIGPEAFSAISLWGKYAHNYLSFPFTLGVVLIFVLWLRWNLPTRVDIEWMKQGGGFIGDKHPPADLFNVGQKMVYWGVVLGGGLVAATGYVLMFPFYGTEILGMQIAQIVHAVIALLLIALILFHIYMGSVGEEGAFEAMWDGTVDEAWAKQHHSIWYDREIAKGNLPEAAPVGKVHAPVGKVHPAE